LGPVTTTTTTTTTTTIENLLDEFNFGFNLLNITSVLHEA
jgi:hypothetical protein